MHSVIKSDDHGSAQAATSALVGQRRKTKGLMAGAMIASPMSVEAEKRFHAALQRVVADIVEVQLRGRKELES
jgi:hypothetical protein